MISIFDLNDKTFEKKKFETELILNCYPNVIIEIIY